MSTLFRLSVSLVAGTLAGWYLLVGLCSFPALTYTVACGHNAAMWLPLFVPLAVWACWVALGNVFGFLLRRRDGSRNGDV